MLKFVSQSAWRCLTQRKERQRAKCLTQRKERQRANLNCQRAKAPLRVFIWSDVVVSGLIDCFFQLYFIVEIRSLILMQVYNVLVGIFLFLCWPRGGVYYDQGRQMAQISNLFINWFNNITFKDNFCILWNLEDCIWVWKRQDLVA